MDRARNDRHRIPESVLFEIRHVSERLAAPRAGDVSKHFGGSPGEEERVCEWCGQRVGRGRSVGGIVNGSVAEQTVATE